jgi:hypothetical protein
MSYRTDVTLLQRISIIRPIAKLLVPTERSERREAIGPMLHCFNVFNLIFRQGCKNKDLSIPMKENLNENKIL